MPGWGRGLAGWWDGSPGTSRAPVALSPGADTLSDAQFQHLHRALGCSRESQRSLGWKALLPG